MPKVCQNDPSASRIVIHHSCCLLSRVWISLDLLHLQGIREMFDRCLQIFYKVGRSRSRSNGHPKMCGKFLWKNKVCRFGVPNRIIIDNRPQLKGDKITQFCINLTLPFVSHQYTNRQVESTNKNILESLKKRLDEAKGL